MIHRLIKCRLLLLLLCHVAVLLNSKAQAFTPADADAIFAAYNHVFYFTNADGGFFHETTDGGKSHFWESAEQMEMVLDACERATNPACLTIFTNLFNGFVSEHGTHWERNDYNDDIMWMVIASERAHLLTGFPEFQEIAKSNFDMCYARAWSTNLGGGLWWKTTNRSKNSCVNGPAAIAAFLLYQGTGDTNYLIKSRDTFLWERAHLFVSQTGKIFDSINFEGHIDSKSFTYNQGTFVGAASFLGYTNEARRAVDYTRNQLCWQEILPGYTQDGDPAGFNGICVRWIEKFIKQRGLPASYQAWLQVNADAAWKDRRLLDNLAWSRWSEPTPGSMLYSWGCSSAVVIMQVVPPGNDE